MGLVGRPHGVRGEISVDWAGDYVPARHDVVMLEKDSGVTLSFSVLGSRWHKGRLLLSLEGIEDRTAAQDLGGSTVLMAKACLPAPGRDEAFLADLPGSEVLLPDGELVGVIDHLEFPAGQVVWAIRDSQNNEILFPAQACFIKNLDMQQRRVVIDPPAGLMEIYRA